MISVDTAAALATPGPVAEAILTATPIPDDGDEEDAEPVEILDEEEAGLEEPPVTYSVSRTKQEARDRVMQLVREEQA